MGLASQLAQQPDAAVVATGASPSRSTIHLAIFILFTPSIPFIVLLYQSY
jgi:hypothetical protein